MTLITYIACALSPIKRILPDSDDQPLSGTVLSLTPKSIKRSPSHASNKVFNSLLLDKPPLFNLSKTSCLRVRVRVSRVRVRIRVFLESFTQSVIASN
jgi:hypothetical protein